MSEFGRQTQGNPYRPYAESYGTTGAKGNGSIYDDIKNPLEGLQSVTNDSNFSSGIFPAGNGEVPIRHEDLESFDLDGYTEHLDTVQAASELVRFAGYRYLATLASCPFSIAQTLLQVQYLPAAAAATEGLGISASGDNKGKESEGDEDESGAPDPDDPAYYEYLRARQTGSSAQYRAANRVRVDHRGYVIGTTNEGATDTEMVRPGYQLPALPESKLTVIKTLVTHPTEGIFSLFKGTFSQWAYDMLNLLLQPTLEGILNEMLGLYDSAPLSTYIDSAAPSALTLIASSAIVGWILSPLELVRTRLMIQSASPVHRKYKGTLDALKQVSREEGGLRSVYFSPYHLVPTLVKHTFDPIFKNLGSFAIDRITGIDPYDQPSTFALGGLIWKTISVVVMLPVDTIRARLMAQPRPSKRRSSAAKPLIPAKSQQGSDKFKEFRTCVPLSTVPYTSMTDCAWRIITEEGESLKSIRKRKAKGTYDASSGGPGSVGHYGLRGLYPGFTMQLFANVAIFGLSFISTEDLDDGF